LRGHAFPKKASKGECETGDNQDETTEAGERGHGLSDHAERFSRV
jgi:hypothetical protein